VFREDMPAEGLPPERAAGDSAARFGSGMLPAEYRQIPGGGSPLAIYPYARAREAVLALARGGAPDPAHGHRLRYANPADGGHPFPTLGVELRHLPRGFRGRPYRSTLSMVFNVVEGSGRARFGEQVFSFGRQDILVAPPWTAFALEADEDCVLFGFSDRAAQEALGFFREETDPPGGAPRLPAA
jgi:gentisate 1,2-dioxygenase